MNNKLLIIILTSFFAIQCHSQNNDFEKLKSFENKVTYLISEKLGENYFDYKFGKLTFLDIKTKEEFTIRDEDIYIKLFSILDNENCLLLRSSPRESLKSLKIKGLSTNKYLYRYNINKKKFNHVFANLFDELDKAPPIGYFEYQNDYIYFSSGNTIFKFNSELKKIEKFFELNNGGSIYKFKLNPKKEVIAIQYTIMIDNNFEDYIGVFDIQEQNSLFEIKFSVGGANLGNWSPNGKDLCYVDDGLYIFDSIHKGLNKVQVIDSKKNNLKAKEAQYISDEQMFLICFYGNNGEGFTDIFELNIINGRILKISNSMEYKYNLCTKGL
jgi:hypothetical protein